MKFFRQTLQHPREIGRVAPSSPFVAWAMLSPIDFSQATTVVELGGGTGAITRHILKRLRKGAQLFVFEPNPVFAAYLRRIKDHRLFVVESSAESMSEHLRDYGVHSVNHVVSSVPMMLLPEPVVENILEQTQRLLRRRGLFVQLHHTTLMKRVYRHAFGNVSINFMPLNIPPAFIMVSRKRR